MIITPVPRPLLGNPRAHTRLFSFCTRSQGIRLFLQSMGASSSYPTPALPSSRTVIVTGGNTGIGYETAKAIARMGAMVIIACRLEEKAKEVPTTV